MKSREVKNEKVKIYPLIIIYSLNYLFVLKIHMYDSSDGKI